MNKKVINIIEWIAGHTGTKRSIKALAVLVVFVTTYILILPAFTLEKDEAIKQGGIDVPQIEQTSAEADDVDEVSAGDAAAEESGSAEADSAGPLITTKPDTVEKKAVPGESKAGTDTPKKESKIIFEGDGYTITADDRNSVLPDNTKISVKEITADTDKKQYTQLCKDALTAVQDENGSKGSDKDKTELKFAKFYDIKLLVNGKEITPDDSVNISIAYDKALQKELKVEDKEGVRVIHFAEDKKTGETEAQILDNKKDNVGFEVKNNKLEEAAFDASGFSVYAVVYTVDFHYETNDRVYEYSLTGGEKIDLSDLVDALGIYKSASVGDKKVFESADAFMSEVKDVRFSDETLVKVSKKKTVNDWTLKSLKEFDSTELLTITMSDDQEMTIKVTDAQGEENAPNGALRAAGDQDIELTVSKNWVDQNGDTVTEGLPNSVTITLNREREKQFNTVDFVVRKQNGPEITRAEGVLSNSDVTINYQYSSNYDQPKSYTFDGREYTLPRNESSGNFTVTIPYNATGTVYLDLRTQWGQETIENANISKVDAPTSSIEKDETYSEDISLTGADDWSKSVTVPKIGTVEGVVYEYTYDAEETAVDGGSVSGRKITVGDKVFVWTTESTNSGITVTNTEKGETTSVSATKRWGANTEPAHAVQFTLYSEVESGTSGAEQIGSKWYKPVTMDADGDPVVPKVIAAIESDGSYTWPSGDDNKVTWSSVPKIQNGTSIHYLVKETGVYEGELVNGQVPDDGTWSSVKGYKVTPSEGIEVNAGGTAAFTNTLEGHDVKIDKTWDENVTSDMAWESTFVLEELEYPYADQNGHVTYDPERAHDDAEHSGAWTDVTPRIEWTISSSSSPQDLTLHGLPKFRTKDDGKVYILMYSVTEIGYKVWDNPGKTGAPVYSWTKGGSYTGDIHFTPEYLEDADEYTDYMIEVRNTKRNEKVNRFIDFDLHKTWAPEDEHIDQQDGSYAVFQLKRKSHQEFKNMQDPEVNYDEFVTVRIVDGAGREISSLQVEKNAQIKLQAGFKAGIDGVGTVDFINTDGTTGHVMIENSSAQPTQTLVSSNIFRVPADATFQYNAGEEYLADGIHGVVISDRCDGVPTDDEDDAAFNAQDLRYRVDKNTGHVVTYSNGTITDTQNNIGWTLDFQDFPQELIDSGETRETTTVYGYYFEEVESNPNYSVTYYQADANGKKTSVLNGDVNNRIYFDDHVIAENKKKHLTIKKYWESLVQGEMPNLVVDIKRVDSDGNNVNVNAGSPSYKKVILTPDNDFEYELYNLDVTRPGGGFYAYVPWELGFTTSKPGDPGVATDGTITDESRVTYTAINNQYFDNPTYAAARDGETINYLRIKADGLAYTSFNNIPDSKRDIISTGSGTICIVNNPIKTGYQIAIRKRWHKFTTAGGMTTESDYDGAYFTAMMVQIVKDASTGDEISRHDYGSTFEWHYDGNTDFKYKDQGKETNVSIRYNNGQWLVVIPEGQGNDGSNLPRYGYYTKGDGSIGVAEYDYTVRELSVTSMDGYHWAISDHIQPGSAQDITLGSGVNNGHIWMLDNYPDADLKIIKHWPTKETNQGSSAVYFKITDQNGRNVLDEIVEKKTYKEHELTAGDVAQYNGDWCLVVRGPANSTEDWIGYIDHLPLFDFSHTVFGDGQISPGGMPGEINYNVKEVAALNSEGQLVDSSNLYIPFYEVTTRGTKGSIRASADGIQLGMYDSETEELQPTIVEVTNNAKVNLGVEKRFYDVDSEGNITPVDDPAGKTEWINEDGAAISRIEYIVKADVITDITDTIDKDFHETHTSTGYVTDSWGHGGTLAPDESGAKVFELNITDANKHTDASGSYWSAAPDELKGLPSVDIPSPDGTRVSVSRYQYTIIEKAIYAGDQEVNKFVKEHDYDKHKEVWKLSNTRSKNEYTDFGFTKQWQDSITTTAQDWPADLEITVNIFRTKNGEQDDSFALNYTINSTNKESTSGISADTDSVYPDGTAPSLKYVSGTKYSYELKDLLSKAGSDEYIYYVTETTSLDGYDEAVYYKLENGTMTPIEKGSSEDGRAPDGGMIVNKENPGVALPMTGGIGTTIFYIFGSMLVIGCGVVLASRRRTNKNTGETN